MFYYILNYLTVNYQFINTNNFKNLFSHQDFDLICLFFDRFENSEFIRVNEREFIFFKKKFPNIFSNSLISKPYIRKILEKVADLYYYKSLLDFGLAHRFQQPHL